MVTIKTERCVYNWFIVVIIIMNPQCDVSFLVTI